MSQWLYGRVASEWGRSGRAEGSRLAFLCHQKHTHHQKGVPLHTMQTLYFLVPDSRVRGEKFSNSNSEQREHVYEPKNCVVT